MTTSLRESPGGAADAAAPAPGAATALLDAYGATRDRFLATPRHTLLTHGTAAELPHDGRPFTRAVAELLASRAESGDGPALVAGALPFDPEQPPAVAAPLSVEWGPALRTDPLVALPGAPVEPTEWRITPVPTPEAYEAAVAEAVTRMRDGELDKVVLARSLELAAERLPDTAQLVSSLARRDPGGYTFAVPSGPGRTLVGASPELLVNRFDGRLTANPLAGSTPRSSDLAEDVRRAAALLESPKDLHEHAVVVDAVREALAPFCTRLEVPAVPTLVRTAAMWHLSTTVTGELRQPAASALELATALHPTPAVCGTPVESARRTIAASEPFERGAYTGMVGWQDAAGDGEWVVTIRCAEVGEKVLRLFAGAGVVADSSPAAELAETDAKFRTFLDAVGAAL
ncbi:isochorismate synthase [Streptomyces sulphureus]|uniref:isochorismate synthase n=1 Tax=Streptomyces sulphureus TaxID=47758 RepID=UPI0003601587|nr:isochorismate synthase [Streptomyces sulphureus]